VRVLVVNQAERNKAGQAGVDPISGAAVVAASAALSAPPEPEIAAAKQEGPKRRKGRRTIEDLDFTVKTGKAAATHGREGRSCVWMCMPCRVGYGVW
jgi:hypothetical protein